MHGNYQIHVKELHANSNQFRVVVKDIKNGSLYIRPNHSPFMFMGQPSFYIQAPVDEIIEVQKFKMFTEQCK